MDAGRRQPDRDNSGSNARGSAQRKSLNDAIDVAESTFAPALDEQVFGDDEQIAQGTGEPMQALPPGETLHGQSPEDVDSRKALDAEQELARETEAAQDGAGPADDGVVREITQELRSRFASETDDK